MSDPLAPENPPAKQFPAGWYDDGHGRDRWWDGLAWTNNFQDPFRSAPTRVSLGAFWATAIGTLILGLIVGGGIGSAVSSGTINANPAPAHPSQQTANNAPAASDAPAAQAAAPAQPASSTLGAPFSVKQFDGTAQITVVGATYGPSLGGPLDLTPSNGGYLVLDVLWETSTGVSSANPLYFRAKDGQGREGTFAIFGVPSQLGAGSVPVGDKSRGNVAFDIGPGPYTVSVVDQLFQEKARITINAAN